MAGRSRYFREGFNAPPAAGDLYEAMEQMGRDVLGAPQSMKIELLGFRSSPHTPMMRENLTVALKATGGGLKFEEVNQEALAAGDLRRGWARRLERLQPTHSGYPQ